MKYMMFFCLSTMLLLCSSCGTEKNKSTNEKAISTEKKAVVNKTVSSDTDCYFSRTIQAQVTVTDDKMVGHFQVNSPQEDIAGTLIAKDYGGDYVADLEYKVGDKIHREKVIINIVANTMNFARSGQVDVDGERMKRNGGEATLDELVRRPCK